MEKDKSKTEAFGEKSSESSNDKENDAGTDTAYTKPNVHELHKAPKLPVKVTSKAQDQVMTREIITSFLSSGCFYVRVWKMYQNVFGCK